MNKISTKQFLAIFTAICVVIGITQVNKNNKEENIINTSETNKTDTSPKIDVNDSKIDEYELDKNYKFTTEDKIIITSSWQKYIPLNEDENKYIRMILVYNLQNITISEYERLVSDFTLDNCNDLLSISDVNFEAKDTIEIGKQSSVVSLVNNQICFNDIISNEDTLVLNNIITQKTQEYLGSEILDDLPSDYIVIDLEKYKEILNEIPVDKILEIGKDGLERTFEYSVDGIEKVVDFVKENDYLLPSLSEEDKQIAKEVIDSGKEACDYLIDKSSNYLYSYLEDKNILTKKK